MAGLNALLGLATTMTQNLVSERLTILSLVETYRYCKLLESLTQPLAPEVDSDWNI